MQGPGRQGRELLREGEGVTQHFDSCRSSEQFPRPARPSPQSAQWQCVPLVFTQSKINPVRGGAWFQALSNDKSRKL